MLAGLAPSPSGTGNRCGDGQGLLLSRTMLSNHKLPYVGRFACDWLRLATTDPDAAHISTVRPRGAEVPEFRFQECELRPTPLCRRWESGRRGGPGGWLDEGLRSTSARRPGT